VTTANIHNVNSYSFVQTDELLIDANIWLYIHGPQVPKDQRSRNYDITILTANGNMLNVS
jgi:hypothetical protein